MLYLRLLLIFSFMILSFHLPRSCAYRILGIFPLNARSHMMMFEHLMKGLARRGHQVDVVSTFPQKKPYPNYTDIIIPSSMPLLDNYIGYVRFESKLESAVDFCIGTGGNTVCEAGLEYPEIQQLIRNPPTDPPYDLLITEVLCANCFMAFGSHLKVPVIGLSSSVMYPWNHDVIGNPENLAFVPNNLLEHRNKMNLWNRIYNVVHTIYTKLYFNYYTTLQTELIRKHFGPDTPDIRELERDLALVLVNSHISLNGVKSTIPAHIEVGGLHIQDDDSEIPAEDKKWLDESSNGFIYVAFGSIATIETFPKAIIEIIYKSLGKIAPIRVFMKVRQVELLPPGLPSNIRPFDWIPQLKVLKHKHIRAFITHGGLMGTQEAISCGVPMIGMPLFADQFLNIDRYVNRKIALRLDLNDLTEAKLDLALNEVLHNPIYRKMTKKSSERFLDRPLSAMDEACYWVEYIIRHGNKALRTPALDLSWWQLALLDVYSIIIIATIVAFYIFLLIVQCLLNIVNRSLTITIYSKKHN